MTSCIDDKDLVRFVDGALSVEETERARAHVASCSRCREEEATLRELIGAIHAPAAPDFDVRAHVRSVMAGLDRPVAAPRERQRDWRIAGMSSIALGAVCLATYFGVARHPREEWRVRGGSAASGIERDVGVAPFAAGRAPHTIVAGSTIGRGTPITAAFRNVGRPAFLLLFAIDARGAVHWVSPAFERPEDDPASTALAPAATERLLPTTAVLEGVPAGPLRIVAVVTSSPAHVSDVESLAGGALGPSVLSGRFPDAMVRETVVRVDDTEGGSE